MQHSVSTASEIEQIQKEIEKELEQRKNFWLEKMNTAATAEILEAWHHAMLEDTTLLARHNIGSDDARDWSQEAEDTYKTRSKEVLQGKSFIKNYSWPAMGLAVAGAGLATVVAAPAVAIAGIATAVAGIGYALFDTFSRARSTIKSKKEDAPPGVQQTKKLNLMGSASSLVVGGVILGLVLTGVFPPAGIIVLSAIVCAPYIAKLAIRAMKAASRQQEAAKAREEGKKLFDDLDNLISTRDQLKAKEEELREERNDTENISTSYKDKPHPQRTLEEQLAILRSARLSPIKLSPSPHPDPQLAQEEEENIAERDNLIPKLRPKLPGDTQSN